MCKLVFLLACVFDCSFFKITEMLSILILDQLCMNLLCLYRYFSYFSNVTSTYYMEMK